MLYNYKKSLNFEPRSDSKRWNTTTATGASFAEFFSLHHSSFSIFTALAVTATAIREIDRGSLLEDMRSRKINNTKSSIHFGNNAVDYISDMKDNQRRCQADIDSEERIAQTIRNKQMKKELTQTSFSLGS